MRKNKNIKHWNELPNELLHVKRKTFLYLLQYTFVIITFFFFTFGVWWGILIRLTRKENFYNFLTCATIFQEEILIRTDFKRSLCWAYKFIRAIQNQFNEVTIIYFTNTIISHSILLLFKMCLVLHNHDLNFIFLYACFFLQFTLRWLYKRILWVIYLEMNVRIDKKLENLCYIIEWNSLSLTITKILTHDRHRF